MLSLIRYIKAKRRLVSHNKTIEMMGGEENADPTLLAQKELTELECEYFSNNILAEVLYILMGLGVGYSARYFFIE